MKSYLLTKIKYLPTFSCLIVEMGVSGYFSPIDGYWIFTRVGLVLVFCAFVIADQIKTIQFLPLALIALSLMSISDKWQSIEMDKIKGLKSDYITNVKAPLKPVLPLCDGLTKWRKSECENKSEKLQLVYSASLEKYNSRIVKSESKIEGVTVELTLYEQLPIWIYVILISVMSLITFKSTPKEEKKVESNFEEKDLRARILSRIDGGMSNLSIASELKIDRRRVAHVRASLVHPRTVNVQPMSNVVKFDGRKKA